MANYIGNIPSQGEFKKLDSIASSFDGSTTQFNLNYGSVSQSVGGAEQLIVSLNGVVQEPGTAYTLGIGGGSIVFASAPASSDTCHIVLFGGVGGTTTPTDGSVTASKLDPNLKDYLEETFTADGTQTVFTLTRAVIGANTLLVTIDGIVQPSSAFTASGTTLTISEVLAVNTNVRVVHMGVKAGVYVPADDSVTPDMLANSINTDIASKLPLAGGTMTGALTTTGMTVDKASSPAIILQETTGTYGYKLHTAVSDSTDYGLRVRTLANKDLVTFSSNNDISFYDAIGSGAKFFWDASAESLELTSAIAGAGGWNEALTLSGGYPALAFNETGTSKHSRIGNDGDGSLSFFVNGTSSAVGTNAAVIDSSGNLLVTKTSQADGATAGHEFLSDGRFYHTKSGDHVGRLNRLSTDGEILRFAKDGTTVGSIGTVADQFYMVSGNTGFRISNTGNAIYPAESDGTSRDAAIDIGAPTARFKDLYLSGGVYLGGTGPANKLDDYEEGTFTTTISSAGYTLAAQHCVYVKMGGLVHINAYLSFSAVNGSSNSTCVLGGLPFASSNFNGGLYYTGVGREDSVAGDIYVVQQTRGSNTWAFNSMDGVQNNSNQPIVTGRNYSLSITYRA